MAMRNLHPCLRLMRFPLVFTAIGDAWAVRWMGADQTAWSIPPAGQLALLAGISFCLYGLGMVLNDVLDAERDLQAGADRPIPSGQVARSRAALLAGMFAVGALALAWPLGRPTMDIAIITLLLILAYDGGLKRMPAIGLLLLGLIRAAHCQLSGVAGDDWNAPLFNSLFLFLHVTIISWIAYNWEDKQPAIGPASRWLLAFAVVLIGIGMFDIFGLGRVALDSASPGLRVSSGPFLVLPLLAAGGYAVVLLWIVSTPRLPTGAQKGRMAMRIGLPWLLVYDAAFCAAAGRWVGVAAMALLLVAAVISSRLLSSPARPPAQYQNPAPGELPP